MKIHLAWIRVTAAAAIAAGVGVHPAAAQYAPMRPIPAQPAAPPQAQPAVAPATPYVAYRSQPSYPQQQAYPQTQAPTTRYQPPAMTYQAPVTPVAPYYPPTAYQAPATQYHPQPVAYPQTAMAQYPVAYGGTPYVAQQQPTEAIPAPQQSTAGAAPAPEAMPGGAMPVGDAAGTPSGYPAAGCNCGAGGYSAGQYYGAGGAGACGAYPDGSACMEDCGNDNIWFGGVYYLYMDRTNPRPARLTVEVPTGSSYPYYPPSTTTVVSTRDANYDFRSGVEVRFGSTFQIGDGCDNCNSCGSGYGYTGCGCNSCAPARPLTTYAWEVAWWGLDNDINTYTFVDNGPTRIYGMKNFVGLEYNNNSAYGYMPVNSYYDYGLPIPTPPGPVDGETVVLAQRVRTDFQATNLELNMIRFPLCCDTGCGGCGGGACGCDAGGCNTGCGCDDSWTSNYSGYASCGVRYFHLKDTFSYDTEYGQYTGGVLDLPTYDGFTFDNNNELCYDLQVKNDLIGPQFGWTSNYCVGCRWNFFCNSTFGIFNNHMTQFQRVWTGGDGTVRFTGSGDSAVIRSSKNDVAFLGELRVGGSYDMTCHWRAVLAYRALALTGIATSVGQIPVDFSDRADVARINSDNSMIIHGVQTGVECRY